jgi:hypothetical protein
VKKTFFTVIILLFASVLSAQKESDFYKNEVKMSFGDAALANAFWANEWRNSDKSTDSPFYANVSFSYFYRSIKWLWVGGNFINYFGDKTFYDWREYYVDGTFEDFSESKMKYCAIIAPEIRFSYLNRERAILYSSFSRGIGWKNGFDNRTEKYPKKIDYFQITLFGVSSNFGKNSNIFLGGEFGVGFKGFYNFHGGYRF